MAEMLARRTYVVISGPGQPLAEHQKKTRPCESDQDWPYWQASDERCLPMSSSGAGEVRFAVTCRRNGCRVANLLSNPVFQAHRCAARLLNDVITSGLSTIGIELDTEALAWPTPPRIPSV
jgi:hypothetical protein